MHKNLIFVSQFCMPNNTSIEFFPTFFQVKDLSTGAILLRGQNIEGVYEWPKSFPSNKYLSTSSFVTIKPDPNHWHRHLGHPSNKVLRSVLKSFQPCKTWTLPLEACMSCYINKSHRFPFGKSSIKSSRPLEIIYSYVWVLLLLLPLMVLNTTLFLLIILLNIFGSIIYVLNHMFSQHLFNIKM